VSVEIESQASAPVAIETPVAVPAEVPTQEVPKEEAPKEEPKPAKKSLREMAEEDEDYRKELEVETNRRVQKELSKFKREREREVLAKAVDEPINALEYVQKRKAEIDEEDGELTKSQQRYRDAEDIIKWHAQDPDWALEYNRLREGNTTEFNKRYASDPHAFAQWANKQVIEARAEAIAEKKAQTRAEAIAAQLNKTSMQNVPTAPAGGPSAGGPSYRTEQDVRNALAEDRISAREARVLLARLERR
jgi:hypothetical protein